MVTIIYQHMKGCITSNHNINRVYHGNAIGSMNKCWVKTAKKNIGSLKDWHVSIIVCHMALFVISYLINGRNYNR